MNEVSIMTAAMWLRDATYLERVSLEASNFRAVQGGGDIEKKLIVRITLLSGRQYFGLRRMHS